MNPYKTKYKGIVTDSVVQMVADVDVGLWMLDYGCWIMDVGLWMLDVGCWLATRHAWMLACHATPAAWWMLGTMKNEKMLSNPIIKLKTKGKKLTTLLSSRGSGLELGLRVVLPAFLSSVWRLASEVWRLKKE